MSSTSFELISSKNSSQNDFEKRPQHIFNIHALRTALFVTILLVAVIFQVTQDQFINTGVWIPVYITLLIEFLINGIFLFSYERIRKIYLADAFILAVDAAVITSIIYFTGTSQSIFIFLYLVNIIFTGLIYQRRGALLMALWTSSLLSLLLIVSPQIQGQGLYFAVGVNNLAFFAVAILSGMLSEQMNFMGVQLTAKTKDLEALQDLNQLIVENVGTGLVTVDLEERITYANRAAAMILDDLGLRGKFLTQVFKNLSEKLAMVSTKRSRAVRIEEEFLNYKNERLHLEAVISALLGSDKEMQGYVIIFQDVTQMKRMEFQMRQQEKLAAVGQLAAGIAHEIRNPLASISGSIQMLASDTGAQSPENQRLMRIVLKEIDRLNDLISEFLEFVRPDVKAEHPVDLNRLVTEVLEMVQFNKTVRSDVRLNSALNSKGVVLGHFDKLKQAILNIVINSYQAMEKSEVPELHIETKDMDDHVLLTIRDNGIGIEEKNLRRIFEPFHTTKPKGTGLGLAITHKILENHEARVYVESEPGRGTSFMIEFPAQDPTGHANGDLRKRA